MVHKEFFQKWENQMNEVKKFLLLLGNKKKYSDEMEIISLLSPHELDKNQVIWLDLIAKYTGLEKEFFKTHYVPIDRLSFEYFIDLSQEKLPIFKYKFQSFAPLGGYLKITYVFDLDFFTAMIKETTVDISKILDEAYQEKTDHIITLTANHIGYFNEGDTTGDYEETPKNNKELMRKLNNYLKEYDDDFIEL